MERGRLLIIDDDPVVRDLLSTILSGAGNYITDTAEDGLEGLEKIKNNNYDIVISDLTMPRLNGMELLRELKTINPFIPVVVITGNSSIDSAINAMKEGARDFITKPFSINNVVATTNRILGERQLLGSLTDGRNFQSSLEKLNSELFKKLQEISLLQSISDELDRIYDNKQLYERLVEMASRLMMAKEVSFGIVEDGNLKIKNAIGIKTEDIPLDNTIFETVMRTKKHVILPSYTIHPLKGSILNSPFLSIPLTINSEVFGIINISDSVDGTSFTDDEVYLALTFARKAAMKIENNALYEVFYNNLINTLKSLVISIEARDTYTKNHSERVTQYALYIAEVMNLGAEDTDAIRFGGYLHDIGKIGIRDTVLLKPDRLTDQEMAEIRLHPVIGDNIVKPLRFFPKERELILYHHERFDGKGYPNGLEGEKIPLISRILAVADTYDAITSSRPYRAARTHEFAVNELKKYSGTQFDKHVINAFLQTRIGRGNRSEN